MATPLNFEVNLPGLISLSPANIYLFEKKDPASSTFPAPGPFAPAQSNMFVQTDQPLAVTFDWTASGAIFLFLAGTWKCTVYLEMMGGGEYPHPPASATTAVSTGVISAGYKVDVNIPPITQEGLYRVVATITLQGPGGMMLPVAGFAEIGLIQVYESL
ncbi:MAG: hypothetical protein ACK4TA_00285 [Saprospiraceae bacterium]